MKFFAPDGTVRFGKHKGKPAAKLEPAYVEWAKVNISGFKAELDAVMAIKAAPRKPNVRYYKLDSPPRKFIP